MEKIGTIAKRHHLSSRTLHYYDEIGLLVPEKVNGIRMYSKEDERTLKRILVLKSLDFSLDAIATFLKVSISSAEIVSHRDTLIAQRDAINRVISMVDSYALNQVHENLVNPIGVSVRKIIGDREINEIYHERLDLDANEYIKRVDDILEEIKSNLNHSDLLEASVSRYYHYFTDDLHLDISRKAFERIIADTIYDLDSYDSDEKLKLVEALRIFAGQGE